MLMFLESPRSNMRALCWSVIRTCAYLLLLQNCCYLLQNHINSKHVRAFNSWKNIVKIVTCTVLHSAVINKKQIDQLQSIIFM
jgi:hypothetical protein